MTVDVAEQWRPRQGSRGARWAAALACVLAGPFALPPQPALAQASDQAYQTIKSLGAAMDRCWFASNDPAFAGYSYSPEPNASTGPRILIVPKSSPQERPVLVIVVAPGNNLSAFGPMTTSPLAGRIGADLRRWIGGSTACK
jgi:hypothetical protein